VNKRQKCERERVFSFASSFLGEKSGNRERASSTTRSGNSDGRDGMKSAKSARLRETRPREVGSIRESRRFGSRDTIERWLRLSCWLAKVKRRGHCCSSQHLASLSRPRSSSRDCLRDFLRLGLRLARAIVSLFVPLVCSTTLMISHGVLIGRSRIWRRDTRRKKERHRLRSGKEKGKKRQIISGACPRVSSRFAFFAETPARSPAPPRIRSCWIPRATIFVRSSVQPAADRSSDQNHGTTFGRSNSRGPRVD